MALNPDVVAKLMTKVRETTSESLTTDDGTLAISLMVNSRNVAQEGYNAKISRSAAANGTKIACAGGCSSCCHQSVFVLPFEAVGIAAWLKASFTAEAYEATKAKVLKAAEYHSKISVGSCLMPCPFLESKRCSIYPVRPGNCAALLSLSRTACDTDINKRRRGLKGKDVPFVEEGVRIGSIMQIAIGLATMDLDLQTDLVELAPAVAQIMIDPTTADAWRSGKHVFQPANLNGHPRFSEIATKAAASYGLLPPAKMVTA